ncbi:helix-turn-helix transcriptional regulator [Oceaniglobus ichthyenteri]|uniref:helix-turn-helix transcriptional regulator n=1 Tax=Oceaniglobus ichthyenteri TaxID=2136177 RepID=UPI000D37B0F4|nr:helix-turn-helix domain-containing protein [Oceaniglobus ichthyenteri]
MSNIQHIHVATAAQVAEAPRVIGYVSAATLAQLLDISAGTVAEWVKQGHLPRPIKIGGSNRWKWTEIEKRFSTGSSEPVDPILKASRGG